MANKTYSKSEEYYINEFGLDKDKYYLIVVDIVSNKVIVCDQNVDIASQIVTIMKRLEKLVNDEAVEGMTPQEICDDIDARFVIYENTKPVKHNTEAVILTYLKGNCGGAYLEKPFTLKPKAD